MTSSFRLMQHALLIFFCLMIFASIAPCQAALPPTDALPPSLAVAEVAPDNLPLDHAFKRVHGKGTHSVYLFSDIDCPFCVLGERVLKDLDNVTIYTFLMPLPQIHPLSVKRSERIWCAKDKGKAWDHYFEAGELPDNSGNCQTPIDEIAQYAKTLGIRYPAFIFPDGKISEGPNFIKDTLNQQRLAALIKQHAAH